MGLLKHKDFEEIAKAVTDKFQEYEDDDVEITVWLKEDDAVHLVHSLVYDQGIYIGGDVISSMGGCGFTVDGVRFKIMVK